MKNFQPRLLQKIALLLIALVVRPRAALAYTDEYQVYDATIANIGQFNLMLHNNYTPDGLKTPDFPDAIISDQAFIGVPEWSYGVTDWFEQGLYLPLYSITKNHNATINGFKLRELFVRPHAKDHKFFYGLNFELSFNAKQWEPKRITSEVRSIVGWHLAKVDLIINPIFDTDYTGGFANLIFVPAERIAYNINSTWTLAVEEYADYGPIGHVFSATDQFHQVWAVFDRNSKFINIEAGVGFGLTRASDKLIFKLMLSGNLN